jgi:RecB family exonuclease
MLLVGPPGSGKTHRVLAGLAEARAAGRGVLLVVPTASMAGHLRHQLARQGSPVSPEWIQPLRSFVENLTPECRELSPAAEAILAERSLADPAAAPFREVAGYAGFQQRLLDTFREFWSAGLDSAALVSLLGSESPFTRVMRACEGLIAGRGFVHRSERVRMAAEALRSRSLDAVFFDGFPNLTAVELDLVLAAAQAARSCVVTLPETGAEETRRALLDRGFPETVLTEIRRPQPEPVVIESPSPEREVEDIAGRILADRAKSGRAFREYGLILRSPETYGPLVAAVFERFGIPFRLNAAASLADHAAVRYLAGLLEGAVDGFDALATLELLKLGGSGLACDPELDRYDFDLREKAPGAGVLFLLQAAEPYPRVKQLVARLEDLAGWTSERLAASDWGRRAAALPDQWFSWPAVGDGVSRATAQAWRSLAAALEGWRRAAEEAAALVDGETGLAGYLRTLQAVLRLTPQHVPDRRRNVVQVLSVYEARQWELPVVFVCGLVEKQFPQHHSQNLFFPDGVRQGLALQGVRLRTSEDLDREERVLFEMARTRATEQLYLTYPARGEAGAETLRSWFLEPWAKQAAPAVAIRAQETPPSWRRAPGLLTEAASRAALLRVHQRFGPSALEKYLQCPFLFFAEHTLRLESPPAKPEERIDDLLRGAIIHRTIAQWASSGHPAIGPVFERVFREACAEEGIRLNFAAEALEMQLRADLERFARFERERPKSPGFSPGRPESDFSYLVDHDADEPIRITGRIDHHEISDAGAVVVVDYKYSTEARLRVLCREQEEGARVQAPLYLLGLEAERGLAPAGMLFYGLRDGPSRRGWVLPDAAPGDRDLERLSPAGFRAMLEAAAARTVEVIREIREGHVEVRPRDSGVCRSYCRFRNLCRVSW